MKYNRTSLLIIIFLFILSNKLYSLKPDYQEDLESLINNVETISSLIISRNNNSKWTITEISAITEALLVLPYNMRFQDEITLEKEDSIFILGASRENQIKISPGKRTMKIKEFDGGITQQDKTDSYHRSYLKQVFVLNLALFYYEELSKEEKEEWMGFSLWVDNTILPGRAENINPGGFASEIGRKSPEYDFATFAVKYFVPPEYKDPINHVKYRLPEKYKFFESLFGSGVVPLEIPAYEPGYRDWVDPGDVEHIELLISTPTSSSAASIAGHALLLIKRKQDYHDGRDSLVLGFVGETSKDKNNGIDGIRYIIRGLTGYYTSMIQEENLHSVVQRATILENRDVIRFRLNLTDEEIGGLIQRFWVIKNSFTYKYKFFNLNCVSMLLDTINHVLPKEEKIDLNVSLSAPMLMSANFLYKGKLGDFVYPEYWSIGKKARYASGLNRGIQDEILHFLKARGDQNDNFPLAIHNEAGKLFAVLFSQGSGNLGSDPLFREPVLKINNYGRGYAYLELTSLFIAIYRDHVADTKAITMDEYYNLSQMLIRFFMNAKDREMYIAIPSDVKEKYSKNDPIPPKVSREYLEKQLYDIQLRQSNSQEIMDLMESISSLRNFVDSKYPNSSIYTLGRDMQKELTDNLVKVRENIAFTHGYYPVFLSFGYRNKLGRNYTTLAYKSAIFYEELGHNSIFVLKQDMRFELLSGGFSAWIGLDNTPFEREQGRTYLYVYGTIFDFDKIFTGDNVDYHNIFNHGFGLTFMESQSILWDGQIFFPDTGSDIKIIEMRYIINIFELDEFKYYVNLKLGAGYNLLESVEGFDHFLGVPLGLEGKFHLAGNFDNILRFSLIYEPLLNFTEIFNSSLKASIEISWSLGKYTNSLFYIGMELDMGFIHQNRDIQMLNPQLFSYLKVRI